MGNGMKQRRLRKRVSAVWMAALLSAVMVVAGTPQFAKEAQAAENQLPTKEQFATVEELKSFNTNDNDGAKNPAKVYFGNNDQQWWIAGSQQENGLTLFAASALAKNQKFEPNYGQNKQYSADWKCDYISTDGSNPTDVYPNHYGASPLRTTLQGLETSYFTSAERGLMNSTTIYTNDTKNRSVYSTTDKLYLAYGDYGGFDITAGTNNPNNLNDGLRIANVYLENSGILWLRAPYVSESNSALVVCRGRHADDYFVISDDITLVPAFELNLSSVIFASAAPAASSDGQLQTSDAYTLRYKTQASIGTATISQSKQSVAVTDVTNENTYLVVQTKDGAWAKKVSDNDLVFANEMSGTLTSFENCKVWLETTTDRITYASESTQGNGYNVKVNVGNNLTVNGGNTLQFNVSGDITEITIKANDGYYLPDDYISNLQSQLNGLRAAKTNNGFTIKGTPISDVNITLPAAAALPKAEKPEVKISKTASSISVHVTNYQPAYGTMQYKLENGQDWISVNGSEFTLSELEANKNYKVSVRFSGQGIYQPSDETIVDEVTAPASYEITMPMTAAADGSENTISIDNSNGFDLGYNGKVNVKIKDTDTMKQGVLSLTREHGNNETITSQLLVNGNPFADLSQNVAAFKNKNDKAIPFAFQRPAASNILAGTYKGTVVFEISYSEEEGVNE